ncbi:MAG: 4-hydroxybutyrate dehydrogenase [Tyzzerella sp.]|nr:4-hydroxybutyrate dehydrogenase [Tyzzerella sp.]
MKLFQQYPEVQKYTEPHEFVKAFEIGEGDFILASKTIYNKYFSSMNLEAEVRFKNDYGKGEPTDAMVDALLADFRRTNCNRIIAIGGGAVIDMAKILLLDGEAKAAEYYQRKVPLKKVRSLIAVPTTCGAGSESSNISIAEILEMGTKFGLADNTIYPDYAVLIPTLLTELPYDFFATSAIDALIHAIESYVSPRANLYTRMFSEKAMEMILQGFQEIAQQGPEYRFELLDEFLTASDLAGIAFGNAGTGAVHAMSYPLSGTYHVTHGEANYQFLTEVFKHYQAGNPDGDIKVLNAFLANVMNCEADDVYNKIEELLGKVISKKPLRGYGMKEEEIESFAISVEKTQQRLMNQAYVKFCVEEMMDIYRALY